MSRPGGLKAEIEEAMRVLQPNMPESGLVDACRQVKQAAITHRENSDTLIARNDKLRAEVERLQVCSECDTSASSKGYGMAYGRDACWKCHSPKMVPAREVDALRDSLRRLAEKHGLPWLTGEIADILGVDYRTWWEKGKLKPKKARKPVR